MKVIIGEGELPFGSGWLPTRLDGLLLLMALYYSIWLIWLIWPNISPIGQYGFIWLYVVSMGLCSPIWLHLAANCSIWL